jgi:hypothetical protein
MKCDQNGCELEAVYSFEWLGRTSYACKAHGLQAQNIGSAMGNPVVLKSIETEDIVQIATDMRTSLPAEIREAALILVGAALDLIEADPHRFSKRPCATCQAVSAIIGRPFGCIKLAPEDKIYMTRTDPASIEASEHGGSQSPD